MTLTVEQGAQQLVDRARLGDQIALSQMVLVREAAKKGVSRARRAYSAMLKYAERTPYVSCGCVHVKPSPIRILATRLANAGSIGNDTVLNIAGEFAGGGQGAFLKGYRRKRGPIPVQHRKAFATGRATELAQRIQAVREGAPIASISAMAAWELGE
jgi:hypothetical protein